MTITAPYETKEEIHYKPFYSLDLTQKTITFFNDLSDSYSTNSNNELVGGQKEKWQKVIEELCQSPVEQSSPHLDGEDMVRQSYELKQKTVCYPQFDPDFIDDTNILNPATATFADLEQHALIIQELSPETIKSRMRSLRKMEEHPYSPVNFKNPSPRSFANYMNCIKMYGDYDRSRKNLVPVTKIALVNRRKAWYMCLVAWGVDDIWPKYKIRKIPDRTRDIKIPTPETVRAILTHKYVKNRDLNRLIQYHFFFGFLIGFAPEKEFVILNVDDVTIDENGNYLMRVTRPKVNNNSRILKLEKTIAVSPVHKSVANYLKHIRPKFAKTKEKALFINPKTGERWTNDDLRRFLSKYGKMVYKPFFPYLMRHWCGTARMIEWGNQEKAYSKVNYWLGHKEFNQTKTYVEFGQLFNV